ncbi:MAG: hypothetical protein NWF07_07070 [Candidatus Bathyarchaeota archaeon]|nr:hypothetical protein [Candidatus Bathyarchaeota archaeon]
MRGKLAIFMILALIIQVQPVCAASTPQETTIDVQSDGVTRIAYLFTAESTSLQTNITLLGENIENLFIVNEDGLPLEYIEGNEITVYSLGSSLVNLTYLTADLTSKAGIIWALEFDSPISTEILLPNGATIINLNNIPLEIDTVDDRTQLVMPAGLIEVSYTINIIDSETLAQDAINAAEEAIHAAQLIDVVVDEAEYLLFNAENLYQQGSYLEAEEKASQAIGIVNAQVEAKQYADSKLSAAEAAINVARDAGRTDGLADAEALYASAVEASESGDYDQASVLADQALDAAIHASKTTDYTLIIAGIAIAGVLVGAYMYTKKKQEASPVHDHIEFDLERLFDEHPELRIEDREVLRYLAENDGEAFAYDIRERFDIPRTSTWRMVQRLQRFEVVDERKVGGQSLINIKPEYRRNQ